MYVETSLRYTKKFTVTYNHKPILDVKPVEILNESKIGLGNYKFSGLEERIGTYGIVRALFSKCQKCNFHFKL